MRFVPVEKLPEKLSGKTSRSSKHKLEDELKSFMDMNVRYARVDYNEGEYDSILSLADVLRQHIRKFGEPIKVVKRNWEIYLIRRDI